MLSCTTATSNTDSASTALGRHIYSIVIVLSIHLYPKTQPFQVSTSEETDVKHVQAPLGEAGPDAALIFVPVGRDNDAVPIKEPIAAELLLISPRASIVMLLRRAYSLVQIVSVTGCT
ncbi:hypothetical protein VOLCADRAFT_100359 [Volvox carteri f. nagariensis]|uniref:Uncharacterized protein n=1 Tax=Volvox carteri f. nagariensis TaxID=3068 RepID=D8UK25_VOLCA|nr:uncharacterized protein VOLCADRAFT_100359 [Volvox carteri f. nagariensis]EFJ39934.1 hypothetical protein VOLCADRAFT_100359 [Volvox carteri f. nagariensis]|eukprot:XP_002959015.1 hypothetical protein VOLCADRAFT_100359 [Volvox carteri f. nagariensis]